MNQVEMGALIRTLRQEQGMTQHALAEVLGVTEQAISKWERGLGCPDPSLLRGLAAALKTDTDTLLAGSISTNKAVAGNVKKSRFYVCPTCGNLILSAEEGQFSCCGNALQPLIPQKAEEKLKVEMVEQDYFITTNHPMTREHYIPFVAFLRDDTMVLKRRYPQWDFEVRIPRIGHGMLLWYCTQHGLFYQYL